MTESQHTQKRLDKGYGALSLLPVEVRLLVYENAFKGTRLTPKGVRHRRSSSHLEPSLLGVSRLIFDEALPVLFRAAILVINMSNIPSVYRVIVRPLLALLYQHILRIERVDLI